MYVLSNFLLTPQNDRNDMKCFNETKYLGGISHVDLFGGCCR